MRPDNTRCGAMVRRHAVLLVLLAAPAAMATAEVLPQESPTVTTVEITRTRLFAALKAAASEAEARETEAAIWRFWMSAAPDSTTRRLVDDAMSRRGDYDFTGARDLLDEAITRSPS